MEATIQRIGEGSGKHLQPGIPDSFDWTEATNIIVSPVYQQGSLDSCWAFAISGAVEAVHNINASSHSWRQMSPQDLINCVSSDPKDNTAITDLKKVYKYIQENGLCSERDCTFAKGKTQPNYKRKKKCAVTYISGFQQKTKITEEELLALVYKQPVVAVLEATDEFLFLGKKDVYALPTRMGGRGRGIEGIRGIEPIQLHAVLIVGYGTSPDGTKYWKVKNSHGNSWSDGGYGKIIRQGRSSVFLEISYPEATVTKKK